MSDWNFNVNLAGVTPAGAGTRTLPTGYYMGKIVEAEGTVASTGRPQVKFRVEITDPEFAGVVRTTWLGIPQNDNDNVRYYWRAVFESAGYTPAQIEAGTINASPALFIDRPVTVHFTAGDKDAGTRDDLKFLAPAAFAAGKKAESVVGASTGAALGGVGAKVTAPAGGGLGGMTATGMGGGMGGGMGAMGGGLGGAKPAGGGMAAADLLKALGA